MRGTRSKVAGVLFVTLWASASYAGWAEAVANGDQTVGALTYFANFPSSALAIVPYLILETTGWAPSAFTHPWQYAVVSMLPWSILQASLIASLAQLVRRRRGRPASGDVQPCSSSLRLRR